MALSIASGFALQSTAPNFERDMFATVAEMKNYPDASLPDMYVATCVEDNSVYYYNKTNDIDTTTGKWRRVGSGDSNIWIGTTAEYEAAAALNTIATGTLVFITDDTPDGISSGIIYDSEISATSENAVTNKAISAALDKKVDKVEGKGLSTYDFDDTAYNKLDGIQEGANKTVLDTAIKESNNPVTNTAIKNEFTNVDIKKILNDVEIVYRELRVCVVSKTLESIYINNIKYNCYTSIETAIDTEYPLIGYQLGLLVIVLEGLYTECIRLYGKKNINIIGTDKNKCIIENKETSDKHGYYYPPLWINPSTTIMNLTVRCNNAFGDTNAYCIHSDDDGTGKVLIKNCKLYCHQHACIGFGTRQDAPLFVEDCEMCNDTPTVGKLFYGHNAPAGGTTVEELHITRCYGRNAGAPPLDIFNASQFWPSREDAPKNSGDFLVYMNDNTFYKGNTIIPTVLSENDTYKGVTHDPVNYFSAYIRKMPTNSGNNMDFANYNQPPNSMWFCDNANFAYPDTGGTKQTYLLDVSAENLPNSEITHWIIESLRYGFEDSSNNIGVQIAYATHKDYVYMRRYINGSFLSWVKISP